MISPMLLLVAVLVALAIAIFLSYGSGFHRGHVSGFREGIDVARGDIASIDRTYHYWRTKDERPRFPCELIISIEFEPGKSSLRLQAFDNEAQWNEYTQLVDDTMLWYDVLRIAPRKS